MAATNLDLESEVQNGKFREDLYFRLNMVELRVPALRERVDDIPEFIEFFSQQFAEKYHRELWCPDSKTLSRFCEYPWPGNIRQLSHVIEKSYVLDCTPSLPNRGCQSQGASTLPFFNLNRLRVTAVRQALRSTGGQKGRAARLLGVHANTLTRMLVQMKTELTDSDSSNDS